MDRGLKRVMYQVSTVVRAALTVGVKAETSVLWVIVFPLFPPPRVKGSHINHIKSDL
jgi:ABC-type transport system involved in cytochrome c biogenesis permease component